jgi:uncharacterized protein (DUF302 family)
MTRKVLAVLAGAAALALSPFVVQPQPAGTGMSSVNTPHPFAVLLERLDGAVARHGLGVVASASASRGAAARGVKIPGNAVVMVFRNDLAVRLLQASVPAGIEAPLRIYVTENADGTARISYRLPSAVFAPYRHPEIDGLARDLDATLARIVNDAAGR